MDISNYQRIESGVQNVNTVEMRFARIAEKLWRLGKRVFHSADKVTAHARKAAAFAVNGIVCRRLMTE